MDLHTVDNGKMIIDWRIDMRICTDSKRITALFLMIILCLLAMCLPVSAEASPDLPGETVYASWEKQEEIASMIKEYSLEQLKKKECCILVESITPVYVIDPNEYLETGSWQLYPSRALFGEYVGRGELGAEPEVYVAKAIDYSGLNKYDVHIFINGWGAYIEGLDDEIEYGGWSRTSFADHSVRIRRLMSTVTDFHYNYSEKDVRFVHILGFDVQETRESYFDYGTAFFISYDGYEALINLDAYDGLFYAEEKRLSYTDEVLETELLSGEKMTERFKALKEFRQAELSLKEQAGEIGVYEELFGEPAENDRISEYAFAKHHRTTTGSTYKLKPSRDVMHVLHIREYIVLNKFILMTKYPKADKLIGTRYATVETTQLDASGSDSEQTEVLTIHSESADVPPSAQAQNGLTVLAVVSFVIVVTAFAVIAVVIKKQRNNK